MIALADEGEYQGGPCVVAMGMFDGMHRGHRALIQTALRAARDRAAPCVVYTYANHPLTVLRPDAAPRPLMAEGEKLAEMERLGVDCVIARRFTRRLADTDARDFLRSICANLRPLAIAAGYNHTFGRGGTGNAALLREMAAELGYEALILPPFVLDGEPVSSSRVRACLRAGDEAAARRLLGREES